MKILFLIRSLAHFSYISTIVASLSREGNQINLSFDPTWSNKHSSHLVQKFVNNYNNIKIIWAPRRKGFWRWLIFFSRELRSYISYLKRTDQSEYYLNRWKTYLPVFIRHFVYMRSVRRVLSSDSISNLLRQFENKVPPDRKIKKFLLDQKPDILVVTPMNMRFSEEVEHVKAANALNIPTVVSVLSWDNLTTKGLFHVIPHLTLVWNKMQFQEAISIHAVPEDKLLVTGSPFFDK